MRRTRHIAPIIAICALAFAGSAAAQPPAGATDPATAPPASASPATAPPAATPPEDATGLATPDGEAWGDEWYDETSEERARAFERRMIEEAGGTPASDAPSPVRGSVPAASEKAPPVAGPERAIVAPRHGPGDLTAAWRKRRDALLRQDQAGARNAEQEIRRILLELDVREVHAFAAATVRESSKLVDSAPEEAVQRAELATRLAPSLPLTHLQLLRAQVAHDPTAVGKLAAALGDAARAGLQDPRIIRLLILDLAAALGAALLAAGAIALLLLAGERSRQFLHDFHHLFPRGASRAQTLVLAGMLLVLPLALGYGPLVSVALLVAALWLYLDRAERIAIGAWLALATLLPLGAGQLASRLSWDGTPAAALHAVEREGDFTPMASLVRQAGMEAADPQVLFVVARARKRMGDLDRAEALYERALERRPRWPEALINLGNIHFLRDDLRRAEELYTRAIDLDPGIAAAYFDLSRVHYDRVDLTLGQAARAKATELDPGLVARYAAAENGAVPANQYVLDVPLAAADIAAAAAATSDEPARLEAQLSGVLLGRMPAPIAPFFGGAWTLLLAIACMWGGARFRAATGCTRCGRPVCWSCDPESTGGNLCGQCITVFARRSLVDPEAREQKERAVRAWQSRRGAWRRMGTVLMAGPLLAGRVGRGAVYLIAGWFFLLLLAMPAGLARPIYEGIPTAWKVVLLLPPLAAFYLLAWRDARGDG